MPYRDGLAAARRRLERALAALEPKRALLTPALRRALPASMRRELSELERRLAGPHGALDELLDAERLIERYRIALTVAGDLAPGERRRQLSRRGLLAGVTALSGAFAAGLEWVPRAPQLCGWPLSPAVAAELGIDPQHRRLAERAASDGVLAVASLRTPAVRHRAGGFGVDLTLFNARDERLWYLLPRSADRALPTDLAFTGRALQLRPGREVLSRSATQLELRGGEHEWVAVQLEPRSAVSVADFRIDGHFAPSRIDLPAVRKLWVDRQPGWSPAGDRLASAVYGDIVAWQRDLTIARCDCCQG